MNGIGMNFQKFYKFCEWLKKQPKPIFMTYTGIAEAYQADTGEIISTSTVSKAVKATGVDVRRVATSDPERVAASSNRVAYLAGVVRRAVLAIEAVTKRTILSEEDKTFLTIVQNGRKNKEKPADQPAE